ncbi:MAG TPA: hypothetical protein VFV38_45425 [Ktedonobacteraceae bacterium]|nr:hypothetical protein [Ktedonobacteraceae bacterium]
MTGVKRTSYGRVRRLAYDLWRGPEYATRQNENDLSGGRCLLHLAIRQGITAKPQLEARSVYSSFEPEDAILRAIYWDSRAAAQNSVLDDQQIKIPAKFVSVPFARVQQWVDAFANLQNVLDISPQQDDSLPICSLRVEIDPVYCLFEKVWQVRPGEVNELQRAWQTIWQQMGLVLQASPVITDVEEHFRCVEGKTDAYDFQAYHPSLTLP